MKLKSRLAVLVTSLALTLTASAAPSTWDGAFLQNGTGGGWLALPNSQYYGIYNFYYTNGADQTGPVANPNGGINVPLAVGEQTFTALCTQGSGSLTTPRTLTLNFTGWGADALVWTSTGPASVSVLDKLDPQYRITLRNVSYRDPLQGTIDRVSVNSAFPDGHTDTLVTFTIAVELETVVLAAKIAALEVQLATSVAHGASLQSQVTALQAQITALQAQVAALQAQLATANATIATANATAATANATVAAAGSELTTLASQLGASQGTTGFTIPGSTPTAQLQALNTAINQLNPGQKKALFENLGGKKK